MVLTVRSLDADTSFVLSFEPLFPISDNPNTFEPIQPFTIFVDPVCKGTPPLAPTYHTYETGAKLALSSSRPSTAATAPTTSLSELPKPDLVVISQLGSDHCHEATLRQLPGASSDISTRTVILAEAAAARTIRSWKHFDEEQVRVLEPWEDPRALRSSGGGIRSSHVFRVAVPLAFPGCQDGQVTVSLVLPDKKHKKQKITCGNSSTVSAGVVGITWRPPPIPGYAPKRISIPKPTHLDEDEEQEQDPKAAGVPGKLPPNNMHDPQANVLHPPTVMSVPETASDHFLPVPGPPPTISAPSLYLINNTKSSTHIPMPTRTKLDDTEHPSQRTYEPIRPPRKVGDHDLPIVPARSPLREQDQRPSSASPSTATADSSGTKRVEDMPAAEYALASRPLSVVYAPHGTSLDQIFNWASSHLMAEAALPVSALLAPMDGISPTMRLNGSSTSLQRSAWSSTLLSKLRSSIGGGSGSHNNTRSSIVSDGAELASRLGARSWISTHDGGLRREMPSIWSPDEDDMEGDDGEGLKRTTTGHEPGVKTRISNTSGKKNKVEKTQIVRLGSGDAVTICPAGVLPTFAPDKTNETEVGGETEDKTKSWAHGSSTTYATAGPADAAFTDPQYMSVHANEGSGNNDETNHGTPVMRASPTDADTETETKGGPAIAVHAAPVDTQDTENETPATPATKKKRGLRTKASMMRLGLRMKSS